MANKSSFPISPFFQVNVAHSNLCLLQGTGGIPYGGEGFFIVLECTSSKPFAFFKYLSFRVVGRTLGFPLCTPEMLYSLFFHHK